MYAQRLKEIKPVVKWWPLRDLLPYEMTNTDMEDLGRSLFYGRPRED